MALIDQPANGQPVAVPVQVPVPAPSTGILGMLAARAAKNERKRFVPLRPQLLERGFWAQRRLI